MIVLCSNIRVSHSGLSIRTTSQPNYMLTTSRVAQWRYAKGSPLARWIDWNLTMYSVDIPISISCGAILSRHSLELAAPYLQSPPRASSVGSPCFISFVAEQSRPIPSKVPGKEKAWVGLLSPVSVTTRFLASKFLQFRSCVLVNPEFSSSPVLKDFVFSWRWRKPPFGEVSGRRHFGRDICHNSRHLNWSRLDKGTSTI